MNEEDKEKLAEAQDLYEHILKVANQFLEHTNLFSIEVLRKQNPTYVEIAQLLHTLPKVIFSLADDFDPMLHQKAFDYVELMTKIAVAIENDDQDSLSKYRDILDGKPFV